MDHGSTWMILGGEVGRVERDAEVGGATFPRSDGDGKRRTSADLFRFVDHLRMQIRRFP